MTVSVFPKVFTPQEIAALVEFYRDEEVSSVRYHDHGGVFRFMKHSQYNLKDQIPYRILHHKLQNTLGQHEFSGGHYMDCHWPFELHVDSAANYDRSGIKVFSAPAHQNKGVLIPLSAHQHFQTLFFDHYRDSFQQDDLGDLVSDTESDHTPDWLPLVDHHRCDRLSYIKKLQLDQVVSWHVGDVLCWPRNQLHCSSNFAKYGLTKQAVVLWI